MVWEALCVVLQIVLFHMETMVAGGDRTRACLSLLLLSNEPIPECLNRPFVKLEACRLPPTKPKTLLHILAMIQADITAVTHVVYTLKLPHAVQGQY